MWNQLPYWVETQICFVVFWLLYQLIVRHETRLEFLRVYLLLCVPVSLVVPAISLPILPVEASQSAGLLVPVVGHLSAETEIVLHTSHAVSLETLLLCLALMGSGALLLIYLLQACRWFRMIHHKHFVWIDGVRVTFEGDHRMACSFFDRVIIDPRELSRTEIEQVLAHELCHVRLKHSWDRFYASLLTIVAWWNPIVWLWQHSLCAVHEYQADRAVLNRGFDSKQYISLLVQRVTDMNPELISGLSHSLLKKRLIMIVKVKRPRSVGWRRWLVFPALAGLMMLFSFTAQRGEKHQIDSWGERSKTITVAADTPDDILEQLLTDVERGGGEITFTLNDRFITREQYVSLQLQAGDQILCEQGIKPYQVLVTMKQEGDSSNTTSDSNLHLKDLVERYPEDQIRYSCDGRSITRDEYEALALDDVKSISILKQVKPNWLSVTMDPGRDPGYDAGGQASMFYGLDPMQKEKVIVEGVVRNASASAIQNDLRIDDGPVIVGGFASSENQTFQLLDTLSAADVRYFVDGEEVSREAVMTLQAERIESVTVRKDQTPQSIYVVTKKEPSHD